MCVRLLFVCVRLVLNNWVLRLFSFTEKVYINACHTTPEWGVCEDLETSSMGGRIKLEMVV